ncbi:hypothetical protein [Rhizobium sp. MHM7A]|uniref:hypothetical protein n=1 Tax=Rhizobium sp. MHM7A TaxID=2583233 RepID=UPI001105A00E|nr:hypothetical protein [Rhizobium sp. MHM7A]TLX16667.1 hypothetical protein FFR93_04815 [Rhizobium sp. MHM7A]
MSEYRNLIVLLFEDNGRKMAAVVVDQHRTRLVMRGEGLEANPVDISETLLWPVLEMPEADLQMDDWCESPLFDDIFHEYRACLNLVERRVLTDGKWQWKQEYYSLGIMGPPNADGYPLPSLKLSENALAVVLEYNAQRYGGKGTSEFGPDFVDTEQLAILDRGLPVQYCKTWDAPKSAEDDAVGRDVVVLQGEGDWVTIMLRGYARVGTGPLFEIFVPIAEMAEADLGRNSLEKYRAIKNHSIRYGARSAKWITRSQSGDWLSGTVLIDKPTSGFDRSPSPPELVHTADVVKEYLGWRALAYGQPVSLLTEIESEKIKTVPFIGYPDFRV